MLPGLCGDAAVASFRLFLGVQPALSVEQRLLKNVQAVYPWFASRKRAKEGANEFLDIDLASADSELLLRYSHTFFVRQQIHDELIEKQLRLLETGKQPKSADVAVSQCLGEIYHATSKAMHLAIGELGSIKAQCLVAGRRELQPEAPLQHHDILCMMRVQEELADPDVPDAESKAKSFLPCERVHEGAAALVRSFFGDDAKTQPDKKLFNRMSSTSYKKVGSIDTYRPFDAIAYYRFTGERLCKSNDAFQRALWGNLFRRIASNPAYITSVSRYWALHSGLDTKPAEAQLSKPLAEAAAKVGSLSPVMTFRTLYFYSSAEVARQLWRVDPFVPLMRLFPLMGHTISEEVLAYLLVEDFWKQSVDPSQMPTEEHTMRSIKSFVEEATAQHDSALDKLLARVVIASERVLAAPTLQRDDDTQRAAAASP